MKKLVGLVSAALLSLTLVACGQGEEIVEEQQTGTPEVEETEEAPVAEEVTLIVGATNVPHAVILEQAQPLLAEQGITLQIERFQDYVMPNRALDEEALDANYFQHIPYLEAQIADHGYEFVNAGGIHIEPIGVYSQEYTSLDELPEGAQIIMSDSFTDHGRILLMLEEKGLITLAEGVGLGAQLDDIIENPKNLDFKANIDASMLSQAYLQGEGDAVLINSNYAIDAGLNPLEDAIAIESGENNPYVNIITVRTGDETRPEILTLIEVLRSQEIQDFIIEEWGGSVVPVTE
ncbi:MetQ/NlpA family ABC transporter substrate-binding protein [Bacillus alkalicellulosilyticus]|uniref:MetQ/NlpA family ABC transporter substrate-binding protein n=1 Tax=Alkalihalobacterium alkalicellulosilyticum TaxID=1912214 RepID=UPI00099828CE|nr:MetQ/NlpA family ABC transporter substrate-binding protein [Bacillus alkalicellulosilyticus]